MHFQRATVARIKEISAQNDDEIVLDDNEVWPSCSPAGFSPVKRSNDCYNTRDCYYIVV